MTHTSDGMLPVPPKEGLRFSVIGTEEYGLSEKRMKATGKSGSEEKNKWNI